MDVCQFPEIPESNPHNSAITHSAYLVLHNIVPRKVFYCFKQVFNPREMSKMIYKALSGFMNLSEPATHASPAAITPASNSPLLLPRSGACLLVPDELTKTVGTWQEPHRTHSAQWTVHCSWSAPDPLVKPLRPCTFSG